MTAAEKIWNRLRVVIGGADHAAIEHVPVLIELEVEVEAADVIEVGGELAIGIDQPYRRTLANIMGDASYGEVSALAKERIARQHALAGRAVIGHQKAHGPWAFLAGQPGAELRIGYAPCEQQAVALER